jgi:hypothetical protein
MWTNENLIFNTSGYVISGHLIKFFYQKKKFREKKGQNLGWLRTFGGGFGHPLGRGGLVPKGLAVNFFSLFFFEKIFF